MCSEMNRQSERGAPTAGVVLRRILVVIPSLTPEAGAETSIAAVLPHVVRAGIEVHLVVLTENQVLVPQVESSGVVVHDLSGSGFARQALGIRRIADRVRPDVVHATLLQASHPTQIGLVGTRHTVVVTWASTPTDPSSVAVASWKLWLVRLSEIGTAHLPRTKFHAVTDGVARTRARSLLVRPNRVSVAERGRDERIFHPPAEGDVGTIRADLGLDDDVPLLLAVGRQEAEKGYVDLVAAFDEMAATNDRVHLLVAGRAGSASALIKESWQAASHRDRIHLLGHRDDVPDLLRSVDAVVCSSRREGAAGALIEAMGCGTPIVSVELDGIEGVLEDGLNALVVPRSQLRRALAEVLDDRPGAMARAAVASSMFNERFTIERSAEQLLRTYAWAISKDRPSPA